MSEPILIACSHGTRSTAGQAAIRAVLDEAREMLGVEVREAFVDVQEPHIDEVVAAIPVAPEGETSAVVVPLLLAGGYHVHVDIARAVRERPDVVATAPLGPDARLIDIVEERLAEAGAADADAVVLAAAGSSDLRSQADSAAALAMLAARRHGPVELGYAAGIEPRVADVVASLGARGTVAVASYLLAPGFFQDRLEAGHGVVTGPLLPHPAIAEIVTERYREAVSGR